MNKSNYERLVKVIENLEENYFDSGEQSFNDSVIEMIHIELREILESESNNQ